MATIGTLAVNIVATTDKFIAGLNNAQGKLGKFVKSISTVQGALVGLGAVGFVSIVKGAVDAGSALFDMAQKLNISTDALGALRFATEQLGGTSAALDGALAKMSVTLGKAVQGGKAAQQAFSMLNLDFRKLASLSADRQFLAIVDAINKIPGAAERAAASQAIFGRGAKELSALIAAGTDEIIRFGDEAARSGALLSNEQAAALDDAADSMAAFTASWQAFAQQMVSTFAPIIRVAMDVITVALKGLRTAWLGVQLAIVSSLENISALIAKLPDWAGGQLAGEFSGALGVERQKLQTNLRAIEGTSGGPLSKPADTKAVEKNTATTNEKMDELIAATKAGGVKVAVAGVR